MRILIAYGTTEGQTRKIVQAVASQIGEMGHDAVLYDTAKPRSDLHVASFDKIIVAGSVHEHRHQENVEIFVIANRENMRGKPALFISVSLAAAFPDGLADARSYVDGFIESTGWQPDQSLLIAGAVRHGEYGYYKEQILEHRVLKGRTIDDPASDHEFTDWESLSGAIDEFV